jgi:outer membrane receptor for ferrienterochelin and colicins
MSSIRLSPSALAIATLLAGLSSPAFAQTTQALSTVVVTASGHEQNIADAPASISVITREELDKKSYNDVVDAVKNIPGVLVTGGGSAQDISMRGMSAAYTLFLVDGRPVSAGRSVNTNGLDGGKQIGLPPLPMIERIEVIRGPMSSLYGSEAMGGVVNIITRKATDQWRGSVGTEFTKSNNDISEDGRNASAFVSGPLVPGLLGLKLNGAYTGHDESHYVGGDDNAESRPQTKRRQGGVELVLTPNKDNTLTLAYQGAKQTTIHTPGKSLALNGTASNYQYDKDIYTLTHDGRYGNLMVNSYLQHDVSDKQQELTKMEKATIFNSQATYVWNDRHVLTFGGQYKQEAVTNETNGLLTAGVPGAVRTADRWLAAVFAEMDWSLTDKFSLTTGLRYNHDEFFGGHLSPRVYGIYRHTPQWTFKGGVSTGYKQPTLAQATAGVGSTTGGSTAGVTPALPHSRALIIGNPDLKPETSTSIEFGAAFESVDRTLSSSLMVFHTSFKDKIMEERYCQGDAADRNIAANWACTYGPRNYFFLSEMQNLSDAAMQGIEATLDYKFLPTLKGSTSYTFTRSEQKSGAFAGQPLNKQPRHMLNASLDWQATPRLTTWVQGNYRSKTSDFLDRTAMDEGTPGYAMFDLGMVFKVSDATRLKAGVYNLANKKVTNDSYGVVLDGRRFVVGLNVDF